MNPTDIKTPPRERLSLDQGWRFHLGDIPFPVISGHTETYQNTKAGRASGAAEPDFDDTEWRQLDLPHDWVVEGAFDPDANLAQGYRRRGFGWYRRHFRLEAGDRGRHLELQFDGIATHATVWVNGILAHRNFCGYTSFVIDITSFAKFGDELNAVAVRVDAEQQEGWWYEGGGIYRHTWLVKRAPVHIATDGVFAQPVRTAAGTWAIPVEVVLVNSGTDETEVAVESILLDPAGVTVARGRGTAAVGVLRRAAANLEIKVVAPQLWSVDTPTLYRVVTTVRQDGRAVDEIATPAGFRTLRFDANEGFFLNDQPLKIKGTCNHQDHAGVGVAVPAALWEFRLRRLKEMGSNAYRCAHHPPAKEFLDAADRLGVLVMNENRLFNPTPEYLRQLEWLVRRDRNHPSVFLWSVFNEEPMQGTEQGYEMVRRMTALVKSLDATRPVTAAMNGGLFAAKNVSQAVDVAGFNYQPESYDRFHAENPALPMLSSEDTSAMMQRGEYVTDAARNLIDSYDTQKPAWGATHREAWRMIATRPWLAGGFVWAGFDYRGEPTPYQWPSAGSFVGCMDQCGFPKTAFHIRRAQWIEDRPVLHLAPHWNWAGREGRPVQVMLPGNVASVELWLNGESLGERAMDRSEMLTWVVNYAPGRLEAVGKNGGIEVVRAALETAGPAVALRLTPDRESLAGDGRDALPVTVEAVDAEGRVVPTANGPVAFATEGPGEIIGLGNGDPNSHEPEQGDRRNLYHGLAQVIVRSRAGAGRCGLRASVAGLGAAEIYIGVRAASPLPAVPVAAPYLTLQRWRHSPVFAARPDPNQEIAANDQNSWGYVAAGNLQTFVGGSWMIYRVIFRPYSAQRNAGGQLRFKSVGGLAEVWIDGRCVAKKTSAGLAPLMAPFAAGGRARTVSVLIQAAAVGQPAGLGDTVVVESRD